jgi:hypothetical protein
MEDDMTASSCVARQRRPATLGLAGSAIVTIALGWMTPVTAQTVQNRTAHIIEWDLPAVADASPGAMVVDTRGEDDNRVWFVTRLGNQRVYRLNPMRSPMKGAAAWTSWDLSADSFNTGGAKKIRASHDRRFVYVRTSTSLQRIDTQNCDTANPQTCERIEWLDQIDPQSGQPSSPNVSDLDVDDYNNIFNTGTVGGTIDLSVQPDPTQSYVQMLTAPTSVPANNTSTTTTVTRWTVGGGAGFCADLGRTTTSFPCVSGVDTWPGNRNLLYFSEPEGCSDSLGAIGELNLTTNVVRQWCFTTLPPDENGAVQQPRQLKIDHWGLIWVVTGSGHLVSLNTQNNRMTKHAIPAGISADPFGVAPDDDVVGYTDAEVSNPRVGMVIPQRIPITVTPTSFTATRQTATITVMGERATVGSGSVTPQGSVIPATVTTKSDGVFVEALVGSNGGHDSESPLGITPAKWRGQGTFFYAVGLAGDGADRVGFVRLPMAQKLKHPRDDDDTNDGCCGSGMPSGWSNSDADDDDDDGQANEVDTPTANEVATINDPMSLGPGQSVTYPLIADSTTLALLATASADDLLGSITVEIYNALGVLLAGSVSVPGSAISTLPAPVPGTYTVKVKNVGISSFNQTPTLVVRQPWPAQ